MSVETSYQEYLDCFYALTTSKPETLSVVREKIADRCREALSLEFTTKRLLFTANPDDDTIDVRCEDIPSANSSAWKPLSAKEPWKSLIGSAFGWGWIAVNQQGYCDGIILSFDDILPTIMLYVLGSSITVRRLVDGEDHVVSRKR